MSTTVRDARPPTTVIRILNPIMRSVLRTPLGRAVRPFALLEFVGRRSGRRYRVPVGWHQGDGVAVVFTPASWRVNFTGGARTRVRYRGRVLHMSGTLVTDPEEVASALESLFANGTPPRAVGIHVPEGHTLTAADVAVIDRAMIRLEPCSSP